MRRLIVVAIAILFSSSFNDVHAESKKSTEAGERQSVDLTIYNQNLSLIREERNINLAKGLSYVILPDIPATIDGTSLHFLSTTDPMAVRVLEQN